MPAAKKVARKASKSAKPSAKKASRKPAKKAGGPAAAGMVSMAGGKASGPGGWQAGTLAQVRRLIQEADPGVVEEPKWRKASNPDGVPVWSHGGMICTGETYGSHVKLTFFRGSELPDPAGLFNAGFAGVRRAIDLHEGDRLDPGAFKALIRAAVELNTGGRVQAVRRGA